MTNDEKIMQHALDALTWCYDVTDWPANGNTPQDKALEALRARLAQPDVPETAFGETEPVAWMHNFIDDVIIKNRPTDITCNAGRWTALYTAPPQREWVGLTDGEYELMAEKYVTNCYFDTLKYAQAIEAKLKEKNT